MGIFRFKRFEIDDRGCGMKVGTDSVLLGAWAHADTASTAIDLGAGSGLLALMIAQRCPSVYVTAIEVDANACLAADSNFRRSPWASRLRAVCADAASVCLDAPVDLIISNPPYFTSALRSPDTARAAARHAIDGLSPLTALDFADRWLAHQGTLAMVTPYEYDDLVTYHAELLRLKIWRKCLVYTVDDRPSSRILWQICRPGSRTYQHSDLCIRHACDNRYTKEYINLTRDFYLNF